MKNLIGNWVVLASMLVAGSAFGEAPSQREVTIGVNEVFVPQGLKDNSEAYVVVGGQFPNSCYRWSRADVKNEDPLIHNVRAIADVWQGMCLMILLPYEEDILLGRLQTGTHTIRFENGDGTYFQKTMVIE